MKIIIGTIIKKALIKEPFLFFYKNYVIIYIVNEKDIKNGMHVYLKTDSNPIKWQAALKSLEKYGYIWNGSRRKPLSRASEPKPYVVI